MAESVDEESGESNAHASYGYVQLLMSLDPGVAQ